ncbi:MAG: sialate O-acetylesterase [Candidatus Brocadiaceae bacterium]|nr:sialate O-acetylesterase [Candidatus Brocadiaceae bacterium]
MRLHALFSDNMVLQRDVPARVWGCDSPGQKVAVRVGKATARAVAGPDGRFMARLPRLAAGGPFTMVVEGSSSVTVRNVMVGEVWLCSGQSNMQMRVSEAKNAEREIAHARHPNVRLFSVPIAATVEPVLDVDASWQVCAPETVASFSAAAYFFGRALQRKLGVPVGLIHSSLGATRIEAWMSREALLGDPECGREVEEYEKSLPDFERRLAEYRAIVAAGPDKYYPADPGNVGHGRGWAAPGADCSDWGEMTAPGYWNAQGMDFSGVLWFRKEVEIPRKWAGRDLLLGLGALDKTDTTYFNNVRVGGIGKEDDDAWCRDREYTVPAALVKPGLNVIATRIYSWGFDGGFRGGWDKMTIRPADAPRARGISLAGTWRCKVEHNFGRITVMRDLPPWGPGTSNSPFALFNGMIRPLIPYGIRGAVWHQGASNLRQAFKYRRRLAMLIRDWRRQWRRPDLWFNVVQQENYGPLDRFPVESAYAELRESQLRALTIPRVSVTVAIDIGGVNEVHPLNKQELGRRIALALLGTTYGRKRPAHSGPIYRSYRRVGGTMRLSFDHVDGGLVAKRGKLKGFAIAGPDRRFVWAQARIVGRSVVVWSEDVPKPAAVRYGWGANTDGNLYNRAGLPTWPFRTDRWPGLTRKRRRLNNG